MTLHDPQKEMPQQQSGAQSNTEAVVVCNNEEDAAQIFEQAKTRLMDVGTWQQVAGTLSANFILCDAQGKEVNRTVQKGDHFKIDIPGPGPATGDGYDWVHVESVTDMKNYDEESVSIIVRPATNPNNSNKDVAHFFNEEATSCFMVSKRGTEVKAAVYGRNEKPNTDAEKTIDKLRNTAVATGAVGGFSKLQWHSLVQGLIHF